MICSSPAPPRGRRRTVLAPSGPDLTSLSGSRSPNVAQRENERRGSDGRRPLVAVNKGEDKIRVSGIDGVYIRIRDY